MRKLIDLENIEMVFDNIAVMIFPVFATAPVCNFPVFFKTNGTF
jgi:hypothetical protein